MSVDVAELAAEIAPLLTRATPPLLDGKQAAELLNVPQSWLMAEARAQRVPSVPLGKYRRFKRDDLVAWIDGRSVGPGR